MGNLTRFVRSGLTFDVLDGGPSDGELVVLLHGFPDEPSGWDAVRPALHRAGYRTVAPDQRGYAPQARPCGRSAYRVEEMVRDVLALMETAGALRAHIVGHDWGAVVGWALAGRHPERVISLTALSVPHPNALSRGMFAGSQALKSWHLGFYQLPWLPERLLDRCGAQVLRRMGLPEPNVDRLLERMREPGRLRGGLAWYRAMPLSLREQFPPSTVPTTFIWGRHDPTISRSSAELTRERVRAPYRFVELGAGHWLQYTHPAEVSAVLLNRIRATA